MKRILMLVFLLVSILAAAPSNLPVDLKQPDGSTFTARLVGDESFTQLVSEEGYTLCQEYDNWYYYGVVKKDAGEEEIVSSGIRYEKGKVPAGIEPGVTLSPEALLLKRVKMDQYNQQTESIIQARAPKVAPQRAADSRGWFTGVNKINNIVILVRCQDQTDFAETREQTEARLNSTTSASVKGFFKEQSYGKFAIENKILPTCSSPTSSNTTVVVPRNYAYFQKASATNTQGYSDFTTLDKRRQEAIRYALNATIKDFGTADLDANKDGYIDLITVIFRGEAIGVSGDLLYPLLTHAWDSMPTIGDKYFFSIAWLPEKRADLATLCHELSHGIGRVIRVKEATDPTTNTPKDNIIPDLYRYSTTVWPTYTWDTMGGYAIPPSHMGAYAKYRYAGWISDIPVIKNNSGWYELNPLTSPTNNCYRVNTSIPGEYYVLEYRKKEGNYESGVPASGLLVYRINTNVVGIRNYKGSDGKTYYMFHEGNGYGWNYGDEIWIYRPNGNPGQPGSNTAIGVNGDVKLANFSLESGRTSFENAFLTNGSKGELNITKVKEAGATIRFCLGVDNGLEEKNIGKLLEESSFIASPTPFNPTTSISFNLRESAPVTLAVYDLKGNQVAQLLQGTLPSGNHQATFNGANLSTGTYFVKITAGSSTLQKKILLLK